MVYFNCTNSATHTF